MSKERDLPRLLSSVGLEELSAITQKEFVSDLIPASIAGLSDGDAVMIHRPYTGQHAELYGENTYNNGKVAKSLAAAAIKNGPNPGLLYDFQSSMAQLFVQPGGRYGGDRRPNGVVRIYPEAMTVDGNPLALERTPSLVIDYGACLTGGRSYIADQMAFLSRKEQPFAYAPLTRMHFTNQALINTYDSWYGRGTSDAMMNRRLYIGREDGVGLATNEMIASQRTHDRPTEVADIILCTDTNHSTPADLEQGMKDAYPLLKEGGALVIRALAQPASDELGSDQIIDWAYDTGFKENDTIHYGTTTMNLGMMLLKGHFSEQAIRTTVLRK